MFLIYVEILVSFFFSVLIYKIYAARDVKFYISVIVISVLFLAFLNLILLPLDIYITKERSENESVYEGENEFIKFIWIVLYWVTFIFSWIIIPFFIQFEQIKLRKNMSLIDKILKSFKNNVPIYLYFVGVGLGFVFYLYYFNMLTLHYLFAVLVTTSNLFGILLVVLLMGYGLINIPRDMWVYSTNSKEIEFCQYRAFELFAESVEAEETDQLRDVNETDLLSKTESLLEDYGNKLFKEYERRLYDIQFKDLSRRWLFLNKIEESEESTYEIKFHKYYRPIALKFMSGILWMISLIIIYSEITMFMGRLNLSFFGRVVNFYDSFFTIYFLCISSLLYLFSACLYGLINLKIKFWRYYIYKNSSSNGVSLLVLSAFISMISFSLCLNFSLMVKLDDTINFNEIVMVIDLLPIFGKKFNMFFPVVLSLTCIFAFFNIYGKILHIFGITSFEFKGTQKALEEGRKILLQIIADHELLDTTSRKES